ncbi:2Fe-2S iron-sulfur cluster-binding protein, partial [Mesorhizobium sp. M0276]|uniref:2Fe-2S iron-sulfur cluster-binding protein n=1 Tax=Mesorhizobium sp. M0276 TaxID=2956928 RepID=UPI003338B1DA
MVPDHEGAFPIQRSRVLANAKAGTPLLYVLRNDFELSGPKFGCGLAQCGSCRMIVNGEITAGRNHESLTCKDGLAVGRVHEGFEALTL